MSISEGIRTRSRKIVPPGIRKRFGVTEDLHAELYDTCLFGAGQNLQAITTFFVGAYSNNAADVGITNVSQGFLKNEKQFLVAGVWMNTYFTQMGGTVPTAGSPTPSELYELINKYAYIQFFMGSTEKQIIWCHRLPAGGGLSGYDNNAQQMHLSQGEPHAKSVFWLKKPYFIGLRQEFRIEMRWMQGLPLNAGESYPNGTFNPLTRFNSNLTAQKLVRIGLVGIEGRGFVDG